MSTPSVLLGAFLVLVGMLASALADRIRGIRSTRERVLPAASRPQASRPEAVMPDAQQLQQLAQKAAPGPWQVRQPIPMVTPISEVAPKAEKAPSMATDVIAALIATGYKKAQATEAVMACTSTERATIEGWTRAALRRAA